MDLDALISSLRADVVHGASTLAGTATEVIRRGVEAAKPASARELRTFLAELVRRILDAQPSMAPLVILSARVLDATDPALSLSDARTRVLQEAEAFRARIDSAASRIAAHAEPLLPDAAAVLTLSASETVLELLRTPSGEKLDTVFCLESRPICEGRRLARRLAELEIETVYAVDAGAGSLLERCDLVVLGADSVGDRGVVNKIGSRGLVWGGARLGRPVYLLTDRTKLLPPGFPQPTADDRPPGEVWEAPEGVRVWNRYFESFPITDLTAVITEEGVLEPREVDSLRRGLPLPPELRRWAEERPPGSSSTPFQAR